MPCAFIYKSSNRRTPMEHERYNNAAFWQIGFFSLNNAATNLYLAMMGYVSYYANSIAGFGVVLISALLTALNIFDAVTDPAVGFLLDKTKGRFGKFRPFMLCGNLIMAVSAILLYFTTHHVSRFLRMPYFILVYGLFIIGYTFQTVVAKSGQSILTDNPKQRPISTYFDSLYVMASYGGTAVFVGNYLVPKYGGFTNAALFREYVFWVVALALLCTLLAMAGIASKDTPGQLPAQAAHQNIRVRDYLEILRHNKPIRMLIIAACTDKFAATVYGHTTVIVMLYGILMDNYGISGLIGVVTAIPTLFVVHAGIRVAQKMGQKKSLVIFTALGIFFQAVMALVLMHKHINTISFSPGKINGITLWFVGVYILLNGCKSITNNMVIPMIADCSDYETYRSGKYIPGIMGTLFSLVDKLVSSLAQTLVAIIFLICTGVNELPNDATPYTGGIKVAVIVMFCVIPMLAWAATLIAMKGYSLTGEKMKAIQKVNAARKEAVANGMSLEQAMQTINDDTVQNV